MSRLRLCLVAVGLCLLAILAAGCRVAAAAEAPAAPAPATQAPAARVCDPRTIVVTGDAEVRVVPDQVILTLGVETMNMNLDTARERNDRIVKEVLALAQTHGVAHQHVQTDYVSIEPRWRDGYERREFLGHAVRKSVMVTLTDVESFEPFLQDVLGAGVTHVHGIEFRTSELRTHRDRARALAIEAAREKAGAMAGELGEQVGQPLSIAEEQSGWWSSYGSWWGGHWGSGMTQNVIQQAGSASYDADSALAPGQITVRARVSVKFELP